MLISGPCSASARAVTGQDDRKPEFKARKEKLTTSLVQSALWVCQAEILLARMSLSPSPDDHGLPPEVDRRSGTQQLRG